MGKGNEMRFLEAEVIQPPASLRTARTVYRVVDLKGRMHGFYSADEANAVFPGAFDPHPDTEIDLAE